MSPRNPAGGATRVADSTAASSGHAPNVTQPQTQAQSDLHHGHNMDHQRHQTSQSSAIEGAQNRSDAGEKVGVFESHHWLVPATVVFAIIAAFALMMILNWAAGGGAPFTH